MANNGVTLKTSQVVVVMVPLPAQGHLNQLLQLSHLIASYTIPVHYVGTATHNRQARVRSHDCDSSSNIHFHEFTTPSFTTPPPNPNATNKFPSHLIPSLNGSLNLREPVYEMIQQLSTKTKRVIVIFDSLMAWVVQDAPSIPNVDLYCFQSVSAFCLLSFHYETLGKSITDEMEILKHVGIPPKEDCVTPEFFEFSEIQGESIKLFNHGNIYNTSHVIEGPLLELLAKEHVSNSETKNEWAIGPFNSIGAKKYSNKRHESLKWLDKQPAKSVIFVSFGTTTSLSDEQIEELAIGLEQSEQNFILVLREADRGDVFIDEDRKARLPEGYEERIKGRGLIVRDWAPQLEILGHSSTGGFMSHCGWNSCMESISMGVPIAAWPMHSDQPRNAILITKVLKIGLIVKDWIDEEAVKSTVIGSCVKRLMASSEGEEMRQKAAELSNAVKESVMEGGATRKEMDSFIAHITR